MRLLIFSITFRPFIGGAEVACEEILKRLPHVHTTIITARLKRELSSKELKDNIQIIRVGWGRRIDKYFFPILAFRLALKLHNKHQFELTQAIMANYAGIAALFFKWKFSRVPYLLTLQSGDPPFFIWIRTWWFYPLYKKVYTKADFIQSISTYLIDRAKRYGYKGHFKVIPNGVDYSLFSKEHSKEEKLSLRQTLQIGDNEVVVITTSRLVYKNAIDQLILGFHEWQKKTKIDAKLLVVGTGKLEKKLKKLANTLNIKDLVIFTGHIDHEELPKYLHISHIFIRPSRSEGMGNSFIEAMAAGVPVIGTEVGGIPDFLVHEKTGLVCGKDNPYSIARTIHELLENQTLKDTIIENGRKLAKEKYDWQDISRALLKIYNRLSSS